VLFIGGGITHDSIPGEEWEETEIKADTLLSVLHQIE
jgi:isochorismate synthase